MSFTLFSAVHIAAIAGSLVFVWLIWLLGGLVGQRPALRPWVNLGSIVLLAAIYIALTISKILTNQWSVEYNLPLHLCDLSAWTIVYALATRKPAAFEAGFYWGLVGGLMAILLPNLGQIDWYFIPFFIWHAFLIAGPLYMMRADNLWPTSRGLYRSLALVIAIGAVMMPLNSLLHSNYMFLNESISSFEAMGLPDWPGYLPFLLVMALALFWLALLGSRLLHKVVKTDNVDFP